jgi:DNA mismatch repair protein PMS2
LSDVSGPVGSKKHKTEVMMNTSQNSKTLRETVSQVFGSKFVAGLNSVRVDLTQVLSSSKDKIEVSKTGTQNQDWRIEGLISKAPSTEASGKAARDIQFFSINGRPVDLPKVSHVISDAWRNFESVSAESSKKRPACILRFFLPNSKFDINVAPDKREVLLTDATLVYDALRDALITLWSEQTEGVFLANEAEFMSNESKQNKISSSISEMKRHPESSSCITDDKIIDTPPIKRQKMQRRNAFVNYPGNSRDSSESTQKNFFDHFAKIERLRKSLPTEMVDKGLVGTMQEDTSESERVECLSAETKGDEIPVDNETESSNHLGNEVSRIPRVAVLTAASSENDKWKQSKLQFSPAKSDTQRQEIEILESMECQNNGTRSLSKERNSIKTSISKEVVSSLPLGRLEGHAASQISKKVTPSSILSPQTTSTPDSYHGSTSIEGNIRGEEVGSFPTTPPRKPKIAKDCTSDEDSSDSESLICDDETTDPISDCTEVQNQTATIAWSGFSTMSILQEFQASNSFARDRNKHLLQLKSNRARSRQTGEYEEEVESTSKKLSLSKDDFISMKVIGQFNLGFIIALGDDGQLWILDQHGCDEKYNFEKLCKETKIHEQKLIAHLPLELSPSEENCVLENLEIFEKNGFRFSHDPSKPPRHRLSLTAVPHSGSGGDGRKAVQFGSQDVGALCAMLGADGASSSSGYVAGSGTGADGAGKSGNNAVRRHAGINSATIRLPKAVAMFASRACRSSIMIGDSLSQGKMEEVVKKMNKLDHPWECAHGRPTIRHVRDLLEQSINDENI